MSTWTLKEKSVGELEVVIEGAEWTTATDKAFKEIAKNLNVPGFRKGKVPAAIAKKNISASETWFKAIDKNANTWMQAALAENSLTPISQPQLDVKDVNAEKVVLVFEFTVEPEAKVGDYKSIEYKAEYEEATEEEVAAEIETMRERFAETETSEAPAEMGDTTVIDFEGFKDGVAFEGGKGENHELKLGSGQFIPGFEEQLVGASAGDEKEINLTFPEDYFSEDLKGAAVTFKVTVKEVKKTVMPEVDDDFAADANMKGVSTVEELKAALAERITERKKNAAETAASNAMMEALAEMTEVEIPQVMIDDEVNNQIQQLASQLQNYGMSMTSYLEMMGKKVDDLKADYTEAAEKNIKMRLALAAVAKAEGLTATEEEINAEIEGLAAQYGMEAEEVKKYISPEMVAKDVVNQKAFDLIKGE